MQNKKSTVKVILAAIGLVGLVGSSAAALRVETQWRFWQQDVTEAAVQGLRVRVRVDLNPFIPDTTLVNNTTLKSNTFFNAEQQCWNGALRTGPSVSASAFRQSRTSVCNEATTGGGTAAGHAWLQFN